MPSTRPSASGSSRRVVDPPKGVPDDELDRLFHGPLEEFTATRNELAKEVRDGGDARAAERVKGLKKPTRAAWLVNQLGQRKRRGIEKLLALGEELRGLQEEMLAGGVDRDRLRAAAKREQAAIDELVKTAEAIGREHGVGAPVLERVTETLQAASSDPDVAEAIAKGRLQREARASGLGVVGGAAAAPRPKARKGRDEAAERRARQEAARRRKTAERNLAQAEKRLEREARAVERARDALAEKEDRLREAERDRAAARRELEGLE